MPWRWHPPTYTWADHSVPASPRPAMPWSSSPAHLAAPARPAPTLEKAAPAAKGRSRMGILRRAASWTPKIARKRRRMMAPDPPPVGPALRALKHRSLRRPRSYISSFFSRHVANLSSFSPSQLSFPRHLSTMFIILYNLYVLYAIHSGRQRGWHLCEDWIVVSFRALRRFGIKAVNQIYVTSWCLSVMIAGRGQSKLPLITWGGQAGPCLIEDLALWGHDNERYLYL